MNRKTVYVFITGCISICIFCIMLWIRKTFGHVTHEQLLWHIYNYESLQHVNINWIKYADKFIHKAIAYMAILLLGCLLFEKLSKKSNFISYLYRYSPYISTAFLLIAINIFSFKYVNINSFINNKYDFIDEQYFVPQSSDITFDNKKNIIIILGESLETYSYKEFSPTSYIKNLELLRNEGQYISNMKQIYGTGWTIAAITAWHFGLPLKTPYNIGQNTYVTQDGFLPNATSIFDILKQNDYELSLIIGSDRKFSGQDILFSEHGNFKIFDKQYYTEKGWNLEKYIGIKEWGFRDSFLFERATEEFERLKKTGRPFVLFIETLDTHFPNGFCPKEKVKYGDIRDSIEQLDTNISSFFHRIKEKINTETDILIILGDHYMMGEHNFLSPVKNRSIYNMFYGAIPNIPHEKKSSAISAMDIAPTLLHCAGARWGSAKFGLGVSIFSNDKTLLDIYGEDKLNELLSNPSSRYNQFY